MVPVVTVKLFLFFLYLTLSNLLRDVFDFLRQESKWHFQLFDEDAHLFEHLHIVLNLLVPLLDCNLGLEHFVLFFWHAWWALVAELSLGCSEFFLCNAQLPVTIHDLSLQFCLSFKQLIHRVSVLSGEFANVDHAISILVAFREQFFDNLSAMLLIDSLLG